MNLSEHFTLDELTVSETAARLGLDNTPTGVTLDNLKRTAGVMELVRATLNHSTIHVDSGYRAPAVNASVGGVTTSAHCRGLACDFVCRDFGDTYTVATAIRDSGIVFDQLILEYGWVHIGLSDDGKTPRRQCLTKKSAKSPYVVGIQR